MNENEGWRPISTAPRDGTRIEARTTTPGWSAQKFAHYHHPDDRLPIPEDGEMWPSVPTEWRPAEQR